MLRLGSLISQCRQSDSKSGMLALVPKDEWLDRITGSCIVGIAEA